MPIHLEELDVMYKVEGLDSALIVACNMCAGASIAMKENKPFIQFFSNFLTSPPLERHITKLQSQLKEKGVKTKWFKGGIIQKFFLCLWTSLQRSKFRKCVDKYDSVIVLGCDSALKTVRESVKGTDCRVIKGMEVEGVMNTKTKFNWPFNISFEYSEVATMCDRHCERLRQKSHQKNEETYQIKHDGHRQEEMPQSASQAC
jgi:hypothetical protein